MITTDLLTKARKVNNYDIDATAGGLWVANNEYIATVPAGKRWFLYGGVISRDVSATMTGAIHAVGGEVLLLVANHPAATGLAYYPESANTGSVIFPWVMDAGEYFRGFMGVAQGVGAYGTCVVLEVKV